MNLNNWKKIKLASQCDLITKGTTPTSYGFGYQKSGINFVKVESIDANGNLIPDAFSHISEEANKALKRSILKRDDVLFSIAGALGRVAIVDEAILPANINQALAIVRLKSDSEISPRYLYFYLSGEKIRQHINSINVQLAQANLSLQDVSSFVVECPGKDQQNRIAAVLSCIGRTIEQTEALIANQQRIKIGLMQDLLTKGIDEHGNVRSEATHEFKDSPLGRIPKDWDVVRLGAIKNLITSGPRGWAKYYSRQGALFLRIGNLTREHINFRLDNLVYVNPPETSEGIRTELEEGDVLISITADLGIIGVIPPEFGQAFVNQHIALVRLDKEQILPRWVAHYLSGYAGQSQFQRLNESGAKAGLNLPTISNLCVAQPKNKDEQQFIADAIDRCTESLDTEKKILAKYQSLKQGLMQDLLTGEVSVEILLEK